MILRKKVNIISTKGLTTDMIHKCNILNKAKYLSPNGLQNHLVFDPSNPNILVIIAIRLNH